VRSPLILLNPHCNPSIGGRCCCCHFRIREFVQLVPSWQWSSTKPGTQVAWPYASPSSSMLWMYHSPQVIFGTQFFSGHITKHPSDYFYEIKSPLYKVLNKNKGKKFMSHSKRFPFLLKTNVIWKISNILFEITK
jgi:hypothetical protein